MRQFHHFPFALLSLPSFQTKGEDIVSIRTFQLYDIWIPPRIFPLELHNGQLWENIVVEEAAKAGCVVGADLKLVADLVAHGAVALNVADAGPDTATDLRKFSLLHRLFLLSAPSWNKRTVGDIACQRLAPSSTHDLR